MRHRRESMPWVAGPTDRAAFPFRSPCMDPDSSTCQSNSRSGIRSVFSVQLHTGVRFVRWITEY